MSAPARPERLRLVLGVGTLVALVAAAPARPPSSTPLGTRPTLAEVRGGMARPSHDDTRGRIDSTGYALTAAQMAKVWERSAAPPAPDSFGVSLATDDAAGHPSDPNVVFSVTFDKAESKPHQGTLAPGGKLTVKNKTVFDVTQTNRS